MDGIEICFAKSMINKNNIKKNSGIPRVSKKVKTFTIMCGVGYSNNVARSMVFSHLKILCQTRKEVSLQKMLKLIRHGSGKKIFRAQRLVNAKPQFTSRTQAQQSTTNKTSTIHTFHADTKASPHWLI